MAIYAKYSQKYISRYKNLKIYMKNALYTMSETA